MYPCKEPLCAESAGTNGPMNSSPIFSRIWLGLVTSYIKPPILVCFTFRTHKLQSPTPTMVPATISSP